MIGIINFTHSDPLYSAIRRKDIIVRESPAKILGMILDDELDGGMVSLVSLIENGLNLSRGANIHSISTTMSTILVSRGKQMGKDMEIAVTSHTRTTELYTEMVLKGLGINYKMIHADETYAEDLLSIADYALVIGDEALRVYGSGLRILFDTGYEFSRLYHLQPLYAALAYKGVSEPDDMEAVNEAVHPSREDIESSVGEASEKLGLDPGLMRRYYSFIRYDYPPHLDRTVEFVRKHLGRS
ncbi:hypothetical protein IX51_01350 [uncultured archaeon]|nr:hypothetical protein IX51_01350 [uncultured archaeon]HKJ96569.1 MqnA/MqnD/SBP family protein [Thermoplasmataceae archaeon]